MKKTFLRMIILLFLVTSLGGVLCIWGQALFVSNIENALFNRDMAYIDQVFYRLDIILALVSGEIQKEISLEEQSQAGFSQYELSKFAEQVSADLVVLYDETANIVFKSDPSDQALLAIDLIDQNKVNLTFESSPNTYGYYVDPVTYKIKLVNQQFFEVPGIHVLIVQDLVKVILQHYSVNVYESLYPSLLNVNTEHIDKDTQFSVGFINDDVIKRAREEIDVDALMRGELIKVKLDNNLSIYKTMTLDQNKWLGHPILLKTITYENLKLTKMLNKMIIYIVLTIILLAVLVLIVYYFLIYKGLIQKISKLNQQIQSQKSNHTQYSFEHTNVPEIDMIVSEYEALKRSLNERENFIAEMGYFDTITGVGNVYLLEKDLNKLIDLSDENDYICLVSIHLRNDREIVEQLSNENIQMFLTTFMTQIKMSFGSDAVYRIADYTFAALSNLNYEYGVVQQIQNLQEYMKKLLPNIEIKLRIIVARYPEHGESSEELLNNIEIASQNPTEQTVIFYSQKLKEVYQKQIQLETDLKTALKNNEIYVVYQPVVDPFTFKIKGVEALVRWKRKYGGHVSPEVFIPIAEKIGIIEDIDKMVFEKSCRMLLLWEEIYEDDFFISINTSPIWFMSPEFIKYINNVVEELDITPSKLCLEIIETCLIEDINQANGAILDAKALGFKIALDDFGKGYSSLNYLRNLKIDKLKIDKDFLIEMDLENQEYNLIDSIVDMAHHMKFEVVVEGVEEFPQLEYLMALKVEMIQGYLFSKPLDKQEISQILLEGGIVNPKKL